jgi:hypothetical protein
MAAAVQGRSVWLREDENDRQTLSVLSPSSYVAVLTL